MLRRCFSFTDDDSLASTYICNNVDVRLKTLRKRILKDAVYEKKITSNDESQSRRNNGPIVGNMTKEMLMEQTEREVLYEEMDWEPMKDEEIALEVLRI